MEDHPDLVSELSIKGPPSETSYQDQINMIKTDLSDDTFDGYLIAPLQSESVASLIADTEKPVMAFDTDIDSEKCLAFIGTGNKEAAKQGALAAVEAAKAAGWETIPVHRDRRRSGRRDQHRPYGRLCRRHHRGRRRMAGRRRSVC